MKMYTKPAIEIESLFSDSAIADGVETLVSVTEVPAWGDLFNPSAK